MTLKTSLLIITVLAGFAMMLPGFAFANVEDGTLAKYTADGKYMISMSWNPPGPINANEDVVFDFAILDAKTQKPLDGVYYDINLLKGNTEVDTFSKFSSGEYLRRTMSFTSDNTLTKFVIDNISETKDTIQFILPMKNDAINENSMWSKVANKAPGKPMIFFCGFEKNAITLADCMKTQKYEGYGWFGKVNILIYAPGWNENPNAVESIGGDNTLSITSRSERGNASLGTCNSGLDETGPNTGLFVGRLKLSGYDYDLTGDGVLETALGGTKCSNSAIDEYGKIETGRDGAVTVSWQYADDPVKKVVTRSFSYGWQLGEINFVEDAYQMDDTLEFKFYDLDLYKIPEDKMDLNFRVYSDSDMTGITIDTLDNWKFKNPFKFTVRSDMDSQGNILKAQPGDRITVEYEDCTLPKNVNYFGLGNTEYSKDECLTIKAYTTIIGKYPSVIIE